MHFSNNPKLHKESIGRCLGSKRSAWQARAIMLVFAVNIAATCQAKANTFHNFLHPQILKDKKEDAKKIGIMVASHNEDTVRFAIEKMKEIGISPEDKVICFGQLLGMCDYITMPLGKNDSCLPVCLHLLIHLY